jgi:Undecaprenyl-phosphate glucose phosphotransferase
MIRRLNLYGFCLRLVCYTLPFLAFVISGYLKSKLWIGIPSAIHPDDYFYLLLLTTLAWCIMAEHYKVSNVDELFLENTGMRGALSACLGTYAIILVLLFLMQNFGFSRLFIMLSAFVLLILTLAMRAAFRNIVRKQSNNLKPLRLLVVGADHYARRTAHRLLNGPFTSCRIVSYVRLPSQKVAVKNAPVSELDKLDALDINNTVDDIILALSPTDYSALPQLLRTFERYCVPIRAVIDIGGGIIVRDRLFQFGRLQMVNLGTTPVETVKYFMLKRGFDVLFATFVLALTSPLLLIVALAIRLTSSGPALFVQGRVGLNGRLFNMYKFRTMRVAPCKDGDTLWTTPDDPRRTPLGKHLRRTSIDELPQFINVLKGDMSVVGPRPERPFFVQKFLQEVSRYNNRHRLKVGITGWAQVNGLRGNTSIKRRIEYDLYYLQNWSFIFDLRIIFLTLWSGVFSKNAY